MARPRGIKQRHPLGSVASHTGVSALTVVAVSSASTGVKISELPVALAASDTDQMEVNQGGVSKRLTLEQVASLVGTELTDDYLPLAGGTLTGALTGTTATFASALYVGTSGSEGYVRLNEGGPANAGYMALFKADNTRLGYIGFDNANMAYTCEVGSHLFAGPVSLTGALTGTSATFTSTVTAPRLTTTADTDNYALFLGRYSAGFGRVAINTAGAYGYEFQVNGAAALQLDATSATFPGTVFAPGAQIQMVSTQTGAVATGTTIIPYDDTIPQIGEGNEYMSLSITPKSATSKLVIDVVWNGSGGAGTGMISSALFQDSTANALAAVSVPAPASSTLMVNMKFSHAMTSGTTSATTFRVRTGLSVAGTTAFNGHTAARIMGGVMASSIVIQEVAT